ncbi:MAG TPA: UDP-N-acetylmuramoyl-tripeptide--D-alanyl-D-alanine ligase [Ignavibacteriaceae bacterium]|nr:UDP-N-acetylmuramoyl-tripeptide--D-alanyl-D-alanine ligase [Ignavibacteriaceae bacterium]
MSKLCININDLFNLSGAELYNANLIGDYKSISIDSRKIEKGALFIAIQGKKFNGHKFVESAVNSGASAIIINKKQIKNFINLKLPIITVPNTTLALGELASYWRSKLKAKVICITGSVGKTTTKDILISLLKEKYRVTGTSLNNNNHIGVPLTIFSAKQNDDFLVLEVGTNHFGEIEYTSKIAKPDYSVITNIGNSHLEFLKSKNGVLKEKVNLFNNTNVNGKVFINLDDPFLKRIGTNFQNKITYSMMNNTAEYSGSTEMDNNSGLYTLNITSPKLNLKVNVPLYGFHSAHNVFVASAIANHVGLKKSDLTTAIKKLLPSKQRLNVTKYKKMVLIDDTYNANPDSMIAALIVLDSIKIFPKKIAVLGDMFELGEKSENLHTQLAKVIKKLNIDEVLLIGKNMQALYKTIENLKMITRHFTSRKSLFAYLKKFEFENSTILVKGSRGMKMEDFVNALKERIG